VRDEEREAEEERERLRARADVRDGFRVDGMDGEEERSRERRATGERKRPQPGEQREARGRVEQEVPGVEARSAERVTGDELVRAGVQEERPLRQRPVERLVVEAGGEVPAAPHGEDVEGPSEERARADLDVVLDEPVPERRGEARDRRESDEERGPRGAETRLGWPNLGDVSRAFHVREVALGSRSRGEG
jgi:hypothetical protein